MNNEYSLVSSLAESHPFLPHPFPLSLNWAPTARFNYNDKIYNLSVFFKHFPLRVAMATWETVFFLHLLQYCALFVSFPDPSNSQAQIQGENIFS